MVKVEKLIGPEWLRKACASTHRGVETNTADEILLDRLYSSEHSPIRTQTFWVEMIVPTFVSVHFVRHKFGVEHFVVSNRDDISGADPGMITRLAPVRHSMIANAQALIQMARKRLCGKAHIDTMKAMIEIKRGVEKVDPMLAKYMVTECEYRNGCHELKPCGYWKGVTNGIG